MAIIFDSAFATFADWENTAFAQAIGGRGCAGGNAFTCSNTLISKSLTVADDITYPPLLTASTVRIQGAIFSSDGVIPDFMSSTNGAMNGVGLLEFSAPLDSAASIYSSSAFDGFLNIRTGGILQLFVSDDQMFGGVGVVVNSASGVWPVDGSAHAGQVLLNFTSVNTLVYSVVIDNVVVISGSYTTHNTAPRDWGSNYYGGGYHDYQGIRYVTLRGTRVSVAEQVTTAWGRFQVENTSLNANWTPCTMPTLAYDTSCTPVPPPPPCPPFYGCVIPIGTSTDTPTSCVAPNPAGCP